MNEIEKLRVLLPHWIEHNEEHATEFRQWAKRTDEASMDIIAAANQMEIVNRSLQDALEKLGGTLEPPRRG